MRQENRDTQDVESNLRGRRRSSPDCFLVSSVFFLYVTVAVVTIGGAKIVMKLQSQLKPAPSPSTEFESSKLTGDSYTMQNVVYLEATSSQLKTSTMNWAPVHYGAGNSVGSNFFFDEDQSSLMPRRVGTYFIYVELNITCTHICKAGLLRVHVGDKLTCDVHLPAVSYSTVTKKCWTMSQVMTQRFVTRMSVEGDLQNWKLELIGSGLGMFHVD